MALKFGKFHSPYTPAGNSDPAELVLSARPAFFHGDSFSAAFEEMPIHFTVPEPTAGWVIISSSRRNRRVTELAEHFFGLGLATALLDARKVAGREAQSAGQHLIQLSDRLTAATRWVQRNFNELHLPVGYLGAGQDGTAALHAAARLGPLVRAILVWESRPDLLRWQLSHIRASTLFVVNGNNRHLSDLHVQALQWMQSHHKIYYSPADPWRFGERAVIPEIAPLAQDWYSRHLLKRQPLNGLRRSLVPYAESGQSMTSSGYFP